MQEAIASSKSIEQVAEKLLVDLGKGMGFMENLCSALKTDRKVDSALSDIPTPTLPISSGPIGDEEKEAPPVP